MFKTGNKQFLLDESVLDLSSGMPAVNASNHHASSVSSMSSRHHHSGGHNLAPRNSSPFNGSDNDLASSGGGGTTGGGMSGGGADFDNDLLSGEDGQGISQVKWTREKIAKLLDLYGKFRVKIEDPKYRKTEIWNKIAKALSDYDGITVIGKQCWDKFRYMKARYLRAREQKRRIAAGLLNGSETSMITFPYFNELQELLGDMPFEQEISNLTNKREPVDAFDNVDVEADFNDQQDAASALGGKVGDNVDANNYDEIGSSGGVFASPLLSNRRKRKFTSPTTGSGDPYEQNGGADLSVNNNNTNNNNYLNQSGHHHHNGSGHNSSEAVGNALSSFMSAVIEMENRKLELFKRFVDLYEKRTASSSTGAGGGLAGSTGSSSSSHLLSSQQNALSSQHNAIASRFKRSTPSSSPIVHGATRSASSIGGKMTAPSSLGATLHSNANNG